ncbi:MAG: hypothetical protein V2J55_21640, partial [Candidatus Competibacteraceae bacterium]|nr:hypothetical protein [Candidatus Competibacteraceae bacterium]
MAVLEEKFTALETEVAEVVNILFELLSEEDPATETVSLDGQLDRYAQQVERIGLAAEAAGFMALRDLSILLQEKLVELGETAQGRALSEDERLVLEEWPTLVVGYLESPQDPYSGEALIQHLQNPAWVTPLAEEDAELMKAMLAMQADESAADASEAELFQEDKPTPTTDDTQSEPEPSTDTAESITITDEQEPEQITTDVEATIAPVTTLAAEEEEESALETLQEEPSGDSPEVFTTSPEVTETAAETNIGSEVATPTDQTLEHAEEVPSAPPLFAAETPFQSLSLDESQEQQIMESAISQDSGSEAEITDESVSLEQLFSAPSVEDTAAIDDGSGSDTMDGAEAGVIATDESTQIEAVSGVDEQTVDAEEVIAADEQPADIAEASPEAEIALLISILESVPEQATAAETGEYIERYAQQVERIGFVAGLQMPGLQDVCLLFQEALTELRERGDVLSDMERGLLESWPMLVMSYLGAPTESGTNAALVEFLQSSVWPTPLPQQDAENLHSVLLPQEIDSMEQLAAETETPVLA